MSECVHVGVHVGVGALVNVGDRDIYCVRDRERMIGGYCLCILLPFFS